MRKIETAALGVTLGAMPVIAGFLTGWWASIPFVPESAIWRCALAGLLLGLLIDAIFLRRWVRQAHSLKTWVWMAVYGFYSIMMLGFFMGVPVFNLLLALPAGVFVGGQLAYTRVAPAYVQRAARNAATFTVSILALVCLSSASIALASPSTASDLQSMLSLPFPVTSKMILGIILCGGLLMLALDWWLTIRCVKRAYKYFVAHEWFPSA